MDTTRHLFEQKILNALAVSDLEALTHFVHAYSVYVSTHATAISHGIPLEAKKDAGN